MALLFSVCLNARGPGTAKPLVPDGPWELIGPPLPKREPSPKGGRPRAPDRDRLAGILFVLKTGTGREDLPAGMGCGSGMTCRRRPDEWRRPGVWDAPHAALLAKLEGAGAIDWSRAAVDSARVKAPPGGKKPARTRPAAPSAAASTRC